MNGWGCRQAWTQEAICLKLQIIWPDFQAAVQTKSPPLPSCTGKGRGAGFQSWLNCTRTRLVHTGLVSRVGGGGSTSPLADGKVAGECQGPTSAGSTRQQGRCGASQHTSEQLAWCRHVTREGLGISMLKRSSCRGHGDVPRSTSRMGMDCTQSRDYSLILWKPFAFGLRQCLL